ncbi:MAG: hypothetical protein ACE5GA_00165 [Candidatus Zixiibacteriota bacterium]
MGFDEPEITKTRSFGVDANPLFGIRRTASNGSGLPGTGSFRIQAGDATFYSDDAGATPDTNVADETGAGLFEISSGVLDFSTSGSDPVTFGELIKKINSFSTWEAWLDGARPDLGIADNDILALTAANSTAGITSGDGQDILGDTSALLQFGVGLTMNGSTYRGLKPHRGDVGYNIKLLRMIITATYTGAGTLTLYECDDINNTSSSLMTFTLGATTVEQINTAPFDKGFFVSEGKRLVLEVAAATTLTAMAFEVTYTTQRVSIGVGGPKNYASSF